MMTDDLSAPLGLRKPARRPRKSDVRRTARGCRGVGPLNDISDRMDVPGRQAGGQGTAGRGAYPDAGKRCRAGTIDADLRVIRLSPDDRPNVPGPIAAGRRAAQQDHHHHRRHERPRAGSPDPDLGRRRPRDLVRRAGSNRRTPEAGAPTAALHQQFALQRSQRPKRTAGKPDAAVRVRASGD